MSKCNCESYNQGDGTGVPEVVLTPEDINLTDGKTSVCVDACISDVVLHLWKSGLPTLNSCCGHNKSEPSVVIPEECDPQEYIKAIGEIDNREWHILRWELITHRKLK